MIPPPTVAAPSAPKTSTTKASAAKTAGSAPTALVKADMAGDTAKVQALLDQGVSPNSSDASGVTPLGLAATMNHPAVVKLLSHGADVNADTSRSVKGGVPTALTLAAGGISNLIVGAKAPPAPTGYDDDPNFEKKHPEAAQKYAAQLDAWAKGYEQIVRMLLDAGADVNAQSADGLTAIETAASSQDPEIVQMLLAHGARLDLPIQKDGGAHSTTSGFDALVSASGPPFQSDEMLQLP